MKSDFDRWVSGEVLLMDEVWDVDEDYIPQGQFCTKKEAIECCKHSQYVNLDRLNSVDDEKLYKELRGYGFKRFEDVGSDLEYFDEYFTTPSGEKVVAFGEFGYGC